MAVALWNNMIKPAADKKTSFAIGNQSSVQQMTCIVVQQPTDAALYYKPVTSFFSICTILFHMALVLSMLFYCS
jgi:hypothetical protein